MKLDAFIKTKSLNHWTWQTSLNIENKNKSNRHYLQLRRYVYYKRKDSEKWKGPSKENKQHFVKHSGYYIWVYPISLQLIHRDNEDCEGENYINNNVEKLTEMTI